MSSARFQQFAIVFVMVSVLVAPSACRADAPPTSATPTSATPRTSPSPIESPQQVVGRRGDAGGDVLKVNPYGPTVTNPADLTNVGVPEYEVFFQSAYGGSYARQQSLPVLVKYTWDPRWQVSVGTSTVVTSDTPSARVFGDPTLNLKYLLAPVKRDQAGQSIQLSYKAPLGSTAGGLNTGQSDYTLTYLYSRKLGQAQWDSNVWVTDLGAPDTRRLQVNISTALSLKLARHFYYLGEINRYGSAGPLQPAVVQTMHGFSYNVSPALNVSAAVQFGLTAAAPTRTYIVGAVFYLGPTHRAAEQGKPEKR